MEGSCPEGAPESVILVPWTATLLRAVEMKDETTDGVLLESIKRPKHVFGGLPLLATMSVACPSSGDTHVLAARSPLAGKFSNECAPPAFWCVLEAGVGDEECVNMEVRFAEITFSTPAMQVPVVRPKKKLKPLSLVFTYPVLVNSKSLHEDDILVFPRKSTFQIPSPDDEIEDAAEVPSAIICHFFFVVINLSNLFCLYVGADSHCSKLVSRTFSFALLPFFCSCSPARLPRPLLNSPGEVQGKEEYQGEGQGPDVSWWRPDVSWWLAPSWRLASWHQLRSNGFWQLARLASFSSEFKRASSPSLCACMEASPSSLCALPGQGSLRTFVCVCARLYTYVRTCICVCPEPVCLARPGKLAHICVFLCSFVYVRTCLCVCPELLRLANRMCSCALSTHARRSTSIRTSVRTYFGIVLVLSHAYTYALTDVLAWFPCIAVWLKHQA